MFHKEGFKSITIAIILFTVLSLLAKQYITHQIVFYIIMLVLLALLIIVLQFFRNPSRTAPNDENVIVSPVDGKVVVIEEVEEPEYFKGKRLQVSIFMNPFNVHVTRMPVKGSISYSVYHAGKYLVAWHPKASTENERTSVVVKSDKFGEILYRQIAGALAKRIINYAKVGDSFEQGVDVGFIRFGSRVDLYLPLGTKLNVKLNQKVKGATSVIAHA